MPNPQHGGKGDVERDRAERHEPVSIGNIGDALAGEIVRSAGAQQKARRKHTGAKLAHAWIGNRSRSRQNDGRKHEYIMIAARHRRERQHGDQEHRGVDGDVFPPPRRGEQEQRHHRGKDAVDRKQDGGGTKAEQRARREPIDQAAQRLIIEIDAVPDVPEHQLRRRTGEQRRPHHLAQPISQMADMTAAQRPDHVRDKTDRKKRGDESQTSKPAPLDNQVRQINERGSANRRGDAEPEPTNRFAPDKQRPGREHDDRQRQRVVRGISQHVQYVLAAGDQHDRAQPEQILAARGCAGIEPLGDGLGQPHNDD